MDDIRGGQGFREIQGREGRGHGYKWTTGGTLVGMECSVPDCININTLAVTLSERFTKCYHGRKLGRGYISVLFLTRAWESTIISKTFNYKNTNTR